MPSLLLVRHAAAEDRDPQRWPDDAARPLTGKGKRRFRGMLKAIELPPIDRLLSSSYERAWGTAKIISATTCCDSAQRCPALEEQGVDAMHHAAREAFASGIETLAMVGHEPFMSAFAGLLLTGPTTPTRMYFRKGAIAVLDVQPSLEQGSATLDALVAPRDVTGV